MNINTRWHSHETMLLPLGLLLTAFNLTKAFHIDDTFHLEAALHILENPLKPMSGLINWKDDPTPMHTHNQPPLFFFLMAVVIRLFGSSEVPLHLLLSVFTFWALWLFGRLMDVLGLQPKIALWGLFSLSPVVIVNQNVMTDMPLLVCVLGSLCFLIKGIYSGNWAHWAIAAAYSGAGLLIKYAILPLVLAFALTLLLRKEAKKWWVLAIPAALMLLWSAWNYWEYGSVHVADRPKNDIHINKFWAFLGCLGSVAAFLPAFLHGVWNYKGVKIFIYLLFLSCVGAFVVFAVGDIPEQRFARLLNSLFMVGGGLVVVTTAWAVFQLAEGCFRNFTRSVWFPVFLYAGAYSAFIILFAPFNATRHLMPILPLVLLLGHRLIERSAPSIVWLSLAATLFLGVALGISDRVYAEYYREMASISLPQGAKIWTMGHWGWQWYTRDKNMEAYSTTHSCVCEGDFFVYPANISRQKLGSGIKLTVVEKHWQEADWRSFFSGNNFAGLYNSFVNKPAWCLSKSPVDTIYLCRVISVIPKESPVSPVSPTNGQKSR